MPTITWSNRLPPIDVDPDDIRDFKFDFVDWLDGDEVDTNNTSASGSGCTATVSGTTTTTATMRVSDGTVGEEGAATLRLVTLSGRRSDRTIRFRFREQ